MKPSLTALHIATHSQVNGLAFGAPPSELFANLGSPDQALNNYTGELEIRYEDAIYRFFEERFVECTFPDAYRFIIDGITVLSVFDWLRGLPDSVDMARFCISLRHGLAYDYRDPLHGSLTIFGSG